MDAENNNSQTEIITPDCKADDRSKIAEVAKFQYKDIFLPLIPILSVVGGSLNGPISNILPCEGIFLKQVWRFTALNILFVVAYMVKQILDLTRT